MAESRFRRLETTDVGLAQTAKKHRIGVAEKQPRQ